MKISHTLKRGHVSVALLLGLVLGFVFLLGQAMPSSAQQAPARCDDTIDNDGDGLIDDADPGCQNKNDDDEFDPITICHATGSDSNPYNPSPADATADAGGHDGHDGPVWFSGIAVTWGDIIPPFDYEGGHYDGQNWDAAGEAIWENDCEVPETEPETGSITIDKVVTGAGADASLDFTFDVSWSGTDILLSGSDTPTGTSSIIAGSYVITEGSLPTNWSNAGVSCTGDVDVATTTNSATVDLDADETVVCTFTNNFTAPTTEETGTIVISKATGDVGTTTSFSFTSDTSLGGFSLLGETSTSTVEDLGTYSVAESVPSGWDLDSAVCVYGDQATSTPESIVLDEDGETVTCTFTNSPEPVIPGTTSISGMKWNDLNDNGVKDEGEPGLEGWVISISDDDEVGYSATTSTDSNGNYSFGNLDPDTYFLCENLQGGWEQTFPSTSTDPFTDCQGSFGHEVDAVADQPVTGLDFGNHEIPRQCNVTIVSDTTNTVDQKGGDAALALSFIHDGWDAVISGATWIWGDNPVADPSATTTQTFTKTFNWNGPVTSAVLDIASDNSYSVELNGSVITSDPSQNNFTTADQFNVATEDIDQGLNTLKVTVENWNVGETTADQNPAGLLYKLSVNGDNPDCDDVPTSGGDDDDDDDDDDDSGGGGGSHRRSGGGGGSSSNDEGEVLGEQISILPAGAPATGMGGAAGMSSFGSLLSLFEGLKF